MLKR
jgi:hypothetical protein